MVSGWSRLLTSVYILVSLDHDSVVEEQERSKEENFKCLDIPRYPQSCKTVRSFLIVELWLFLCVNTQFLPEGNISVPNPSDYFLDNPLAHKLLAICHGRNF